MKTGIDFSYFGLESGMVFEGNTGFVKVFVILFQFQIWLYGTFEMDFKISFCWRSNLSNDDILSANVRSENRYGF